MIVPTEKDSAERQERTQVTTFIDHHPGLTDHSHLFWQVRDPGNKKQTALVNCRKVFVEMVSVGFVRFVEKVSSEVFAASNCKCNTLKVV